MSLRRHCHIIVACDLQDVLSASICLLFLKTMRLPSLRVATFLLSLMFFYDIFMVFISPLIFHSSGDARRVGWHVRHARATWAARARPVPPHPRRTPARS